MTHCTFPKCRRESQLTYMDKALCAKCWDKLATADSDEKVEAAVLRMIGLERASGMVRKVVKRG